MKKTRFFCGLLSAVLLMNSWLGPVSAETEQTTLPETSSIPETTQSWVLPELGQEIVGDASISMGTHSINAKNAMSGIADHVVDAKAALLYELNTDTMVYAYNVDEVLYPASLTKVMTCLVALELIDDLNEIVTVSEEVAYNIDPSGSGINLVAHEEISMMDLLYALMVKSGNDAASVIAEHLCGSEENFVALMNQRAAQIGCENTHFVNVHGLHDEEHYTCARDMAKIMMKALEFETFQKLYSTAYYQIPATNKSEARDLHSTNYLITTVGSPLYYNSQVIGGKTGFTTPAGRCLVSVAEDDGMKFLCVVMGAQIRYNEDQSIILSYGNFDETRKLYKHGFETYMPTQILSPSQVLGQFDVQNGSADAPGMVKLGSDTVLPAGSDLSSIRYEFDLDQETLTAPVAEGDPIGVVRVWYQANCLAQQQLYAAAAVTRDKPITVSGGAVDPAKEIPEQGNFWTIVLTVILVLLGLIVLMMAVAYVRLMIRRAKRARRRKNRRRSR